MILDMETATTPSATSAAMNGGTSRWSRLASLGLTMQAAAPLVLLAAMAIWGLSLDGDLAFFLVPAIVGAGASRLVRRDKTVWKVVSLVLGVLIAGMLFWTVFGLFEPDSFFDFVPGVLMIGGLLITLIAGVGSIRSRKAGAVAVVAGGERTALRIVPIGLGALVLLSAVLTLTGRETVSEVQARQADLIVDMSDFKFDQKDYSIDAGATVLVKNSDPFLHTFTIDELDIDVTLSPGSERLIEIPDEPGNFVLYCTPHTSDSEDPAEDDMAATIEVG